MFMGGGELHKETPGPEGSAVSLACGRTIRGGDPWAGPRQTLVSQEPESCLPPSWGP